MCIPAHSRRHDAKCASFVGSFDHHTPDAPPFRRQSAWVAKWEPMVRTVSRMRRSALSAGCDTSTRNLAMFVSPSERLSVIHAGCASAGRVRRCLISRTSMVTAMMLPRRCRPSAPASRRRRCRSPCRRGRRPSSMMRTLSVSRCIRPTMISVTATSANSGRAAGPGRGSRSPPRPAGRRSRRNAAWDGRRQRRQGRSGWRRWPATPAPLHAPSNA